MKSVAVCILVLVILWASQSFASQDESTPAPDEDISAPEESIPEQEELTEVKVPDRRGVLKYGSETISSLLQDKEIPILGGNWGGEVMLDTPLNGEPEGASVILRRAKLSYGRGFGEKWKLKLTGNYSKGGGLELADNYLVFSGWQAALLKFGVMKPPFSLEYASRASAITFMERSLATDALSERQSGGLTFLKRTSDHILNGMLVFLNPKEDDLRQSGQGVILHYVYSPIELAGRNNIHVGGSFSYRRNTNQNDTQFRTRPEVATADNYFVDTGEISGADEVMRVSFEASRVLDRFSWQAELLTTRVTRDDAEQVYFWGGYVYASWFLTNDSRNYDSGTGSFIDVIPNSSLFKTGWVNGWGDGWGALEVAARLSYVDLTNEDIIGGRESNVSLGLNWYMNRDVRLMTNLVKVINVDRPGSEFDNQDPLIFSLRAQWIMR